MKTITLERFAGGVYQLQFNRPEKYNAFNNEMISEINTVLTTLQTREDCQLLLITANGKHFSAGADLAWMQKTIHCTFEENVNDAKLLAQMLHNLKHFPAPTIALVQGKTFGGGIGIIACCDFAIAETTASFCFSETKIGLVPAVISPYVIDAIGANQAKRLFLTAEPFTSTRACELGLISDLAVEQPLFEAGMNLTEILRQNSPQALKTTKQLFFKLAKKLPETAISDFTCEMLATLRTSAEGQLGLTAFLEKRKPKWHVPEPYEEM